MHGYYLVENRGTDGSMSECMTVGVGSAVEGLRDGEGVKVQVNGGERERR